MLLVGLFSWWYGAGWLHTIKQSFLRITSVLDFFSVGLLLKTLFSPFKQISVGRVKGSASVQLRAWADLQISRVIGAMVRSAVIIIGLISTILMLVAALLIAIIWPLLPLLPVIAILVTFGAAR